MVDKTTEIEMTQILNDIDPPRLNGVPGNGVNGVPGFEWIWMDLHSQLGLLCGADLPFFFLFQKTTRHVPSQK